MPAGVELSEETIGWIIRLISAAAILVIGIWLAFFVSRKVREKAVAHPRIDTTLGAFFSIVIRYAIVIVVLLVVLQQFGIQTTSLVAVLGASALAIGLALQGTLTNVASGIMIALMRPYQIGDYVELNGREGKVTDLDLFFTNLLTPDARNILIPNGQAVSNPIVNFTREGHRCCTISLRVFPGENVVRALNLIEATMTADPRMLPEPQPDFTVDGVDEYGIRLNGQVTVASDDHDLYRADMLKAVKIAFDEAGVAIPSRAQPSSK
jgi:small conductance mechanosensitive channel